MASEREAIPRRRNSPLAEVIPLSSWRSEKKEASVFPNEGLFLIPGVILLGAFRIKRDTLCMEGVFHKIVLNNCSLTTLF